MEQASAEMIPPTRPEIKELWMKPGRRGVCMHTNKSTPAQPQTFMISHTRTNMYTSLHIKEHVQLKLGLIQVIPHHLYSTRCYKPRAACIVIDPSVAWKIISAVIYCDTTSGFGWMCGRGCPCSLGNVDTPAEFLSSVRLFNLFILLLWLCSTFSLVRISVTAEESRAGKN